MNKILVSSVLILSTGIIFDFFCISNNSDKSIGIAPAIPEVPHIQSLEMIEFQPQENDTDVIWYDDFKNEKPYMESFGKIDYTESF